MKRPLHCLTVLLFTASFCGLTGYCAEPPAKAKNTEAAQSATKDDLEILDTVLINLLDDKGFVGAVEERSVKTKIVFASKTAGKAEFMSHVHSKPSFYGGRDTPVREDLRVDFQKRNSADPIVLSEFKPSDPHILVSDWHRKHRYDLDGAFQRKYPDAKANVTAWLPGYSTDGQTAVLSFLFGPIVTHAETRTYLLIKTEGRWKIQSKTEALHGG